MPDGALRVASADAATAEAAIPDLVDLLAACVGDGGSVSFWPPLDTARATAFWRRAAAEVGAGTRIIVVAWLGDRLVGVVMVDCATAQNQPHRADVQKLLVDPVARRRGIGRALILAAEAAAWAAGRSLLTLDTRPGEAAEPLYRALGWTEAGRFPGYALTVDGTPCDTILFWKRRPDPA